MDQISEDLVKIDRVEQFNTLEFHGYLMGKDAPPELLPKVVDLSAYTPRINEMYETQIVRGTRVDYRVPLAQRLASPKMDPVAGERGCSSYYDVATHTIQFSPILHGEEGSVHRVTIDLIRQRKIPLVEIHTHPEDALFSPQDYETLLLRTKANNRFMKATLLLCPSNQILALASSETAKYDQDVLEKMFNEWHKQQGIELDQIVQSAVSRENISFEQLGKQIEQLKKIAATGKLTLSQVVEKGDDLLQQSKNDTFRNDEVDRGNLNQKQNQGLLGFALSNGVKLYFSTDRSTFKEFSA